MDNRPKRSTKDEIAALRAENPEISAADMAKKLGISSERVRQLLVSLGLPTKTARGGQKDVEPSQAQRLALIRTQLHGGISQRAFAAQLGIEYGRYNNWELGYPIPANMIKKIKDITPGITGDYIWWGDTAGLSVETWRRLQSVPIQMDKRRLARIKEACKTGEKEGATREAVLSAIQAAVPDVTDEEISAVIEDLGKEGKLALRLTKLLKDK